MTTHESIFREAALKRQSAADQFDRLVPLTSPLSWLSLTALGVLLVAAIIWSIIGRIPTRVDGAGILMTHGGQVFDAMAPAAGTLTWMAPIGSTVTKGDVVARFDDVTLRQALEHARQVLDEQRRDLAELTQRFAQDSAARQYVDTQSRENLAVTIADAEQRHAFYTAELSRQRTIVDQGFVSRRFVQETRQQADAASRDTLEARNHLLRIDADWLDFKGRREQEIRHQQEAVNAAASKLQELEMQLEHTSQVTSPIDGRVTEIKMDAGSVVAAGKSILSIETAGDKLELILYIPADQGKNIAPGMPVRIEPMPFKKGEFGTLQGRVRSVSQFPASAEGMTAILQNSQLVARLSAGGAPYTARVTLVTDPTTPSGYAWSAGQGPAVRLSSGTTAAAVVTVRERAPVTMVLPLLRELPGLGG